MDQALKDNFERDGWVSLPRVIDEKTLEVLRAASDALEKSAATYTTDTMLQGVLFEVQSHSGNKRETAIAPGMLRKIGSPSKAQVAFSRLKKDARILSVLEHLGLRAPECLVDQLNFKPARVGTGFPFHQDIAFLVGKTQGRIQRNGGVNLVMALDAADPENGAFEVLGGTHRGGLIDFPYDMANLNEGLFDETQRKVCAMQPGDIVFFDPRLAHGSGPNRSDRQRRLVSLWFVGGD